MRRRRATVHYRPGRQQVGDLWLPHAGAPAPVVVLVHGGFWRAPYTKGLMRRLAADVVQRGWAAWNVEYRRMGRLGGGGNWRTSVDDVAAALAHVSSLEGVDPLRVAVCGHSAGAQLALCALGRPRPSDLAAGAPPIGTHVRGVVSLAGVLDLVGAADAQLGKGAVVSFLGGAPATVPDHYAAASPLALVPIGVDQVLVHGLDDTVVPPSMSERYAKAADAAGAPVALEEVGGHGHLAIIDPRREAWRIAVTHLGGYLG